MRKHRSFSAFALTLILYSAVSYAQQPKKTGNPAYDFVPRETVVFEDDFSRDTFLTDSIHKTVKWKIGFMQNFNTGEELAVEDICIVEKDDHGYYVNITDGAEPILEANIKPSTLADSFTIECDFLLEELQSYIEVDLMKPEAHFPTGCSINGNGDIFTLSPDFRADKAKAKYPATFSRNVWHHFAVAYKNKTAKYYIDHHMVMTLDSSDLSNSTLSLAPKGPLKIRNVRVATGNESMPLNNLLSEKKFVTHAINFDENKSTIKQESISFIAQLTQLLKANTSIKLEIDGHTDNDGDEQANMKLSQERADEVKKQLMAAGIDGKRLTAKGFGASKPLEPNNTPEAKANNRRVEFIKM